MTFTLCIRIKTQEIISTYSSEAKDGKICTYHREKANKKFTILASKLRHKTSSNKTMTIVVTIFSIQMRHNTKPRAKIVFL